MTVSVPPRCLCLSVYVSFSVSRPSSLPPPALSPPLSLLPPLPPPTHIIRVDNSGVTLWFPVAFSWQGQLDRLAGDNACRVILIKELVEKQITRTRSDLPQLTTLSTTL